MPREPKTTTRAMKPAQKSERVPPRARREPAPVRAAPRHTTQLSPRAQPGGGGPVPLGIGDYGGGVGGVVGVNRRGGGGRGGGARGGSRPGGGVEGPVGVPDGGAKGKKSLDNPGRWL